MKKIILAIVAVVMLGFNTAQADARISATTRYVLDTVPVTVTVAYRCAQAYHNGGTYRHMDSKMNLMCTKHTIRKEWDPN